MHALFVACSVLGGGILIVQFVLGVIGLDHGVAHELHVGHADGADHAHDGHASEGLNLRSVRALTAFVAFFGLGGLLGQQLGLWAPLSVLVGGGFGAAAQVGTAATLRAMTRFEEDRTMSLDRAIGQPATVYLRIPENNSGIGKVHVTVQERLIECAAVTEHGAIPTGASVTVIDVDENRPDTLVVVPTTSLLEDPHVVA